MYQKQLPNFRQYPCQQQPVQKQIINPNKTLSWSSINSNYQQSISPLNYKVQNPSSSLIMSSLSHIREDDFETTGSSMMYQNGKGSSRENFHKRKESGNAVHNDFYQYLLEENDSEKSTQQSMQQKNNNVRLKDQQIHIQQLDQINNPWPRQRQNTQGPTITSQHQYIVPQHCKNFTLMNYQSGCSVEQSLHHLQQSQQELSFLKYKLQQAYQKLQKEIMNSYQLEEKIESFRAELQGKQELLQLEKSQNQKLKFTLKAIMKNKSFLQDQMEKGQTKKTLNNQTDRESQLKENLKLKLQLKDITQKLKSYQERIESLQKQNSKLTQDLVLNSKQTQKLKTQLSKKDHYLQTLSHQLQLSDELKTQNKKLLLKQTQYLNKINVLQLQLRKVTDEKITSVGRLKHEIAMVHKQNQQLLQDNQSLSHQQAYTQMSQNQFVAYSPISIHKRTSNKSCNKYSVNKNLPSMNHAPQIFDSEDQDMRNVSHFNDTHQQFINTTNNNNDSLNVSKHRNNQLDQNKQNIQCQNLQQSIISHLNTSQVSKVDKNVGKWKRAQSVSNNSSVYFERSSTQQQQTKQSLKQSLLSKSKGIQNGDSLQKIINSKLSTTPQSQTQDQKLTKYQQHRKNLQNQLSALEKNKRPTKQERERMQKLQKQLYYVDSDIAGLKRKIRRKY